MATLMRKYLRKAKNEWNAYSEVQVLVRDATSNDPWGPSSTVMSRIAREAESPSNYHMMFTTLWKRLTDYQHMRHVLKSLVLIEYLLKHCHERFVSDVRLRSDVIRRLKHYKYFVDGRDIGSEVRHKAQAVMSLLENKDLLQKERRVAREVEGRIRGHSNEYSSGFYDGQLEGADPFGEDRLQIEYQQDEGFGKEEEQKSDAEVEEPVVEDEKPKKKKGKKTIKKKKSKKVVQEMEAEEEDGEHQDEPAVKSPPQYANKKDFFDESDESDGEVEEDRHVKSNGTDDFLSSLGNAKPIYSSQPDLITSGTNNVAAADIQFGWLTTISANNNTASSGTELALFDMDASSTKVPPVERRPSDTAKPEGDFLFDFGLDLNATSAPVEQKVAESADPWDLAKEISVLDNLRVTGDERKIKQNIESRRERERTGPKLKELAKAAREKNNDVNPFDALVQGHPDPAHTGNFAAAGQMALVPAGHFYDPNFSQALVPVQPYGYGYPPMQTYPPFPQDPYGYPRY